jgi:NAD(P)-dependent dehydrogenase (short-subunit alcohol dehydrogenase family)
VIFGQPLTGRTALVTGSSRGIGRAIALTLAKSGAHVIVVARNCSGVMQTVEEIGSFGGTGSGVTCDVSNASEVLSMTQKVNELARPLNILINNVGFGESHKLAGHPDELWHRMLATNLSSAYYVTKAFIADMLHSNWGRIVNVASTAGQTGSPYICAYSAAKHGLLGLTRSWALEFVTHGITVNAICPGYVDTDMTEATISNIALRTGIDRLKARGMLENMNPQKRLFHTQEIAEAALFLCLDTSKGITGQAINIDGGGTTK